MRRRKHVAATALLSMLLFSLWSLHHNNEEVVLNGNSEKHDNSSKVSSSTARDYDSNSINNNKNTILSVPLSERVCTPSPTKPMQVLTTADRSKTPLTEFLNISSNQELKQPAAICALAPPHKPGFPYDHMAHAMQQLYACWSYWRVAAATQHQQQHKFTKEEKEKNEIEALSGSVLLWPFPYHSNTFVKGFLQALKDVWNVTILYVPSNITTYNNNSTTEPLIVSPTVAMTQERLGDKPFFALHEPMDATVLREGILRFYNLNRSTLDTGRTGTTNKTDQPRVAILNRRGHSRSLINVDRLALAIQDGLQLLHPVPVVYFENATFLEQVAFYANHDIVVSPHGAQLTGLALLPAPCAVILEIFPPLFYWPGYYGSLAKAAGLQRHAFIHLSNQTAESVVTWGLQNPKARRRTRNVHLCPNVSVIVESIQAIEKQWHTCQNGEQQHAKL